jgi:pyridoxamine 5'-phosphate oxidase
MHELRKFYAHQGLYDADMLNDPLGQLQVWFNDALKQVPAEWFETNAAMLATSSADGRVTARMILLKGIERGGLLFFTNYDSPKAQQLAENPRAALVVHWPHLGRQVRIEGRVQRVGVNRLFPLATAGQPD